MSTDGEVPDASTEGGAVDSATKAVSLKDMLEALRVATKRDFAGEQYQYRGFLDSAQSAVQASDFYNRLVDLHEQLGTEFVAGKIRAIEAWANGENAFRLVRKSWASTIDKLYRINIEENDFLPKAPRRFTILDIAAGKASAPARRWVVPRVAHEVADDLLRTKFVVPFVDGVVDVSERIETAILDSGIKSFHRYHAKDSGYHARHIYALLPVPGHDGADTHIALEVKVLTKMQDTLGELTHLLYEKKRTGQIEAHKKRKLAWLIDSPDFIGSYIGHAGHFIEASMVDLKNQLSDLEMGNSGQS